MGDECPVCGSRERVARRGAHLDAALGPVEERVARVRGGRQGDARAALKRAGAAHGDFAHVGDVKNPGGAADGEVFVGDARVLNRHLPAAELNKLSAELLVPFKEWCALQHTRMKKESTGFGNTEKWEAAKFQVVNLLLIVILIPLFGSISLRLRSRTRNKLSPTSPSSPAPWPRQSP